MKHILYTRGNFEMEDVNVTKLDLKPNSIILVSFKCDSGHLLRFKRMIHQVDSFRETIKETMGFEVPIIVLQDVDVVILERDPTVGVRINDEELEQLFNETKEDL